MEDIIWLEDDMSMKNLISFKDVSVDYIEIYPDAIESNVIHHEIDEWLYILEGELLVFRGDEKILLNESEHIFIPKGTKHGSINRCGKMVKMLSVCSPKFTVEDMNKI